MDCKTYSKLRNSNRHENQKEGKEKGQVPKYQIHHARVDTEGRLEQKVPDKNLGETKTQQQLRKNSK